MALGRIVFFVLTALFILPAEGFSQTRKKVEILHTDAGGYNARIVANAQRLIGNVQILVDGAYMWCDSLYQYTNKNMVDAFGKVHIVRGDTLNMYADFINYNGDTKIAKARRHVKLIDKQTTLTTDSLDYDMNTDLAYYNYGGTVKDTANVLTSEIGQYQVNTDKAFFRKDVKGTTKDYKIKSDTLIYYTKIRKVYIEGPTYIYNEKDTLYAEYGWYDSMKNLSNLTKNPRIWNINQKMEADSIFYDKGKGNALALGDARIEDIENKVIVKGNHVEYNELTKIATATDSAMMIQYSETDSLFLHADILKTLPDTSKIMEGALPLKTITKTKGTLAQDSLKMIGKDNGAANTGKINAEDEQAPAAQDSTTTAKKQEPRLVLAYNKVRFFREDMQGKCDSLVYWSKDSTIQMFTEPVIWSKNNQISAQYIEMINKSKSPDEIHMKEDAFIIGMEDDSVRFNQIKGKNMIGYVQNNELYKIDVNGNGQSNYYAYDKKGLIGLNKAESSNITIYMKKGKVSRIALIKSPDGELKPLADIEEGDKTLPGFNWQQEIRPKSKLDIFRNPASADNSKKE
jgi:lipopolysaccharide export system protein LptA